MCVFAACPQVIGVLADFKYGVTRWLLLHTNLFVAWLFNSVISLLLVAGSSALVVGMAPAAVSSGVPEVMAYLNGVLLPKVFNIFTVIVKFASCALAVASGLPVGPEGPLIHIGAALGAALSQGHSTTLGFTTGTFRRFRNPRDKRDFVTAGVAVGVATAFNAPIGGLLFAFEEVASFWQHSLGWQVRQASNHMGRNQRVLLQPQLPQLHPSPGSLPVVLTADGGSLLACRATDPPKMILSYSLAQCAALLHETQLLVSLPNNRVSGCCQGINPAVAACRYFSPACVPH